MSPGWETGQGSGVLARGARSWADLAVANPDSLGVKLAPSRAPLPGAEPSQNSPDSLRLLSKPLNSEESPGAMVLSVASSLNLCTDQPMLDKADAGGFAMGVDTGKLLHVVILQRDPLDYKKQRLGRLEVCREWSDLDGLMKRFKVARCVMDAQPEIHMARQLAARHVGRVYVCYFGEEMKGGANWN
jgi:hypothetical protein